MKEEFPPTGNGTDVTQMEETLDPADWVAFKALGHRMLDDMLDYLASVRTRPTWQSVPEEVKQRLQSPLPLQPTEAALVYDEFKEYILPFPTGNIHPRFWGWVMGTGTPMGMLADMLASGMNPHLAGYDQSAAIVERQVIAWLVELLGMPQESSGLLVSGGTVANLTALTVARNSKAGFDVRQLGLYDSGPRLVFYGSSEIHSWAQKAAELLGLGNQSLRRIPVNHNYEMDLEALRSAVEQDRRQGYRPFCVIGTAGTVNTGATDDLSALAGYCRDEDLWFHIDGAFGALAALSPKYQSLVAGLEQADSIAFDLHKWMYLPFEVGCVLVRDADRHRQAFALASPDYLTSVKHGISVETTYFADLGIQLSRGFRALKVWMSLKTHGVAKFGRLIEQNIEQAQYLCALIGRHPALELLAPAPLNVVCFRFISPGMNEAALAALNQEILWRIQESGVAVPSSTRVNGKFALRVAVTNHRSRREDFELFVNSVVEIGSRLTSHTP